MQVRACILLARGGSCRQRAAQQPVCGVAPEGGRHHGIVGTRSLKGGALLLHEGESPSRLVWHPRPEPIMALRYSTKFYIVRPGPGADMDNRPHTISYRL
ncbi:unnamed protein product [Laminaria digitata]